MNERKLIIIAVIIGLAGIIAVGWYLGSPLLIDETVDEGFPFEKPEEAAITAMPEAEREDPEKDSMTALPDMATTEDLSPEDREAVEDKVMNTPTVVMVDKPVTDEWIAVTQGGFLGADSFHQGSGSARIYQQGSQFVLRFEDFSVTNGPDLHVLLTRHPSPASRGDIGEDYIDLGSLKGNMGNQNYEIPDDVDLSDYQSVVIYCVPFHVIFATATLGS